MLGSLSEREEDAPLVPTESEEPALDICSPCSSCSIASSIVVHISEEERQKYEEEIRKLYKQLDDKVMTRCHMEAEPFQFVLNIHYSCEWIQDQELIVSNRADCEENTPVVFNIFSLLLRWLFCVTCKVLLHTDACIQCSCLKGQESFTMLSWLQTLPVTSMSIHYPILWRIAGGLETVPAVTGWHRETDTYAFTSTSNLESENILTVRGWEEHTNLRHQASSASLRWEHKRFLLVMWRVFIFKGWWDQPSEPDGGEAEGADARPGGGKRLLLSHPCVWLKGPR